MLSLPFIASGLRLESNHGKFPASKGHKESFFLQSTEYYPAKHHSQRPRPRRDKAGTKADTTWSYQAFDNHVHSRREWKTIDALVMVLHTHTHLLYLTEMVPRGHPTCVLLVRSGLPLTIEPASTSSLDRTSSCDRSLRYRKASAGSKLVA